MRWKPWAFLPLPPTVAAPERCRSFPEELWLPSSCCRDGTSQAGHKGRAHSSSQCRGDRGTCGEVRAVPLLSELGKVMRGWLETRKAPSVSEWASSSQLPLQLCFNKNRFVTLMLQKAPGLHGRAGQDISFISIFCGKGEHSELRCRL